MILFRFAVVVFILLPLACQQDSVTVPLALHLRQGIREFQKISQTMQKEQVAGILPNITEFQCQEPLQSTARFFPISKQFYEFFLYDRKETLLILHPSEPFIFLQVSIPLLWQNKLRREYESVVRGILRQEKDWSALPSIDPWQDDWFGLYFTPREFNYSLSSQSAYRYKLKQANVADHPAPDFWRLVEAAQEVFLSVPAPTLEDATLLQVLTEKRKIGHKISIFTSNTIAKTQKILPFGVVIGRKLEVTADLLNKQELQYLDARLLTSDFVFLFSLPSWGNPSDHPIINQRDAFVFLMRGDVSPLLQQINRLNKSIATIKAPPVKPEATTNAWCHSSRSFANQIPLHPDGCHTSLHGVLLSEIGDQRNPNDFVALYNTNDRCVDLNLSQAVLQRDAKCKIAEGKISSKHKLSGRIPGRSAYILGEVGNQLGLPPVLPSTFSINGQSDCLALTATSQSIRHSQDPHIFDFIAIGDSGDSEAMHPQPSFKIGQSLQRSCLNRWEVQDQPKPGENIPAKKSCSSR